MPQQIALVWGRKRRRPPRPEEIIEAAQAGGEGAFMIAPGTTPALRLNSDRGRRYAPDLLAQWPDNLAKLEALKTEAAQDVDLFARNQRTFLELYFDFIEARVIAEQKALKEKLAWSDGLFGPHDFVFSAFRPLSNAVMVAVEGDTPAGAVQSCDFAFWTGAHLLAVSIAGAMRGASSPANDQAGDAIVRIALPAGDLASTRSTFTAERFAPEMFAFWQEEATPSSPFRPDGLSATIPG